MPKLLLKFNAAVIKELILDRQTIAIGRKPDNDISINNPAISSNHCKITFEGGGYYVEDLDSTNGTYVNEKRIKKCGLHHEDKILLAKHSLVFLEDSSPAGAAPLSSSTEDETLILSAEKRAEILSSSMKLAKESSSKSGKLRVLKGLIDAPEYELKGLSIYLGKSDRVHIPIKGSGLFGLAPEVAASIHRKPEGFILIAIVPGYPLLNGQKVKEPMILKDGDLIDIGGTTFQFILEAKAGS